MRDRSPKILVVDDDTMKLSVIRDELEDAYFKVSTASNPLEAQDLLAKDKDFDVILTDLRMPGQDGLSFLRDLKEEHPEQAVIVMTAYGTVETAIEAMKLGAFDYIQKPFSTAELMLRLDRLRRYEHLVGENEALRRELTPQIDGTRIIGQSEVILGVLSRIHSVAGTDATILIEGESGTGKELAAKIIHESSYRAPGPFIPVSCAALPRELVETELFGHEAGAFTGATKRRIGRFELAHGGTILLDDVDDIPLSVQVKLLRVLQHRVIERIGSENPIKVNVRVIAATKGPLSSMVSRGEFREDLYYRLNVIPLQLPPLRKRIEDIPLLIEHFLERLALKANRGTLSISPQAVAKLQQYVWPGNVRELEHVLERMVVLNKSDELRVDDVPELVKSEDISIKEIIPHDMQAESIDIATVLAETESRLVGWALDKSEANLAKAARMLNIPRSTLQSKMAKLAKSQKMKIC